MLRRESIQSLGLINKKQQKCCLFFELFNGFLIYYTCKEVQIMMKEIKKIDDLLGKIIVVKNYGYSYFYRVINTTKKSAKLVPLAINTKVDPTDPTYTIVTPKHQFIGSPFNKMIKETKDGGIQFAAGIVSKQDMISVYNPNHQYTCYWG